MKKLFKLFLAPFVLLVFLDSCSNDTTTSQKFLRSMVDVSANGALTTSTFTYNRNQIVSIDGINSREDFTYTGDLITQIVLTDKNTQQQNTLTYVYTDGELATVTSSDRYQINFVHNADGSISYEKVAIGYDDKTVREFHGVLYFQNKNLVKNQQILDTTGAGITRTISTEQEYDNKINPFYNILGYSKLLDHFNNISLNNSISIYEESTDATESDEISSSANSYSNAYTYNASDYPAEVVYQKQSTTDKKYVKTVLTY